MHSDIEQEGLYQNYNSGDPQGSGSDPRVGPNLEHSVHICKHLKNISSDAIHINFKMK